MAHPRYFVVKRGGQHEEVQFDKITRRVKDLSNGLNSLVDPALIAASVIKSIRSGIRTEELDVLAAETAAYMVKIHPDYGLIGGRILASNLHKSTVSTFSEYVMQGSHTNISQELILIVEQHTDRINSAIDVYADYKFDFFAYKTMERSYLLRDKSGKVIETPQFMFMRVALGIHGNDIDAAIETYSLISNHCIIHATPTLFNAGTMHAQMSSCFLLSMCDDSISGIFETLGKCAQISKFSGGIGLSVTNVRAAGSFIKSSGGNSNGIVPMLRVYDTCARYVDQGGGKRKGGFAIYLEPWHKDLSDFLELKKNHGKEEQRARDLFYALWISDIFMMRVKENSDWSLFCPTDCPKLQDAYGEEFTRLYTEYESDLSIHRKTVKAQTLWFSILDAQIETGVPYLLYKDNVNNKNNQQNLGTIRCSNLCTEIVQYTSPKEVAVCNLASVSLPSCVEDGQFNFKKLEHLTRVLTCNLNKVICRTFYPVEEAKISNMRHRPIGIGVQGLADVFILLKFPFASEEAKALNVAIFEAMYYAALSASCDLAKKEGPYDTFHGSPASKGILQFDMWGVQPSDAHNWNDLKADIAKYGLRNSLLLAPMPTASTAQIFGNTECFEPIYSNIGVRRVLAGEFHILNRHLVNMLQEMGMWDDNTYQRIVKNKGSIQSLTDIPSETKALFKTIWEIPQKDIIDMAAARGAFIDQSQSLNLHLKTPTYAALSSMHHYVWSSGLKGSYYLRTQPAADAIQFTNEVNDDEKSEVCTMCSA